MPETTEKKAAQKSKVLLDAHVEILPDEWLIRGITDPATRANKLEDWAEELREFFRDHRSQDIHGFEVRREYEDQCSLCGYSWEPYVATERDVDEWNDVVAGNTYCASCMEEIE